MPPRAKPFFPAIGAGFGAALAGLLFAGTLMAQECPQGCPLSAPLTLKDLQSGFAGETGTVWTIAPDCSFTVARQIGLRVLAPHRQGHLTAAQQKELGEMLDRMPQAAAGPPPGAPPPVNARRLTLSYGAREAALSLPPGARGTGAPRTASTDPYAEHLLEAAAMVRGMLGN